MKIALCQTAIAWGQPDRNLETLDRKLSAPLGCDIILLPEMFASGCLMTRKAPAEAAAQKAVYLPEGARIKLGDCDVSTKYDAEKNPDRNKIMKVNERWEGLKEESYANIQSEEGILKRQTRSIQTEGHFGDIKENENFRRFNYRSEEKVYKEFMLYAMGRNIMKYHRFIHHEIEKYEGKKEQKTA